MFLTRLIAVSLLAFVLALLIAPFTSNPALVLAASGTPEPPEAPMLPWPGQSGLPTFDYEFLCDCVIECELENREFPDPVNISKAGDCSGGQGSASWAYGVFQATMNGYHVEGEGEIRNNCNSARQKISSIKDSLTVILLTSNAAGGMPPGSATVKSKPSAGVLAFTQDMARAHCAVLHEVESSSTDCDRITSAKAQVGFSPGPGAGVSIGASFRINSTGGGASFGTSRNLVIGEGIETDRISVSELADTAPTTEEVTTVTAWQEIYVWARGSSTIRYGSLGRAHITEWDPQTTSRLECGGDADGDGHQDSWFEVCW